MKKWFNYIFRSSVKHIVWHQQAEYSVEWIDKGYTSKDNFNYTIYYYPYKLNEKYKLVCSPTYIEFFYKKKIADQHIFYPTAVKKLREFGKSSLIEILINED